MKGQKCCEQRLSSDLPATTLRRQYHISGSLPPEAQNLGIGATGKRADEVVSATIPTTQDHVGSQCRLRMGGDKPQNFRPSRQPPAADAATHCEVCAGQ